MFEIIKAGGWLMVPILLCSLVAFAICLERFIGLKKSKIIPDNLFKEVTERLKTKGFEANHLAALAESSPLGSVFSAGLAAKDKTRLGMQRAMEHAGSVQIHKSSQFLNLLGSVAAISPLLGLLGTVIGMIDVFSVIMEQGASQTDMLAGGISTALITTAAGLTVAIPALFMHRYFTRKLDDIAVEMEQQSVQFLDFFQANKKPRVKAAAEPVAIKSK